MKKSYCIVLILILCISGSFADMFRLSSDYRPVRIKIYWAEYDEEREHTDYEYNKKGQLIKSLVYRGGNSPALSNEYEYNKSGKLVKKSMYSSSGLTGYIQFDYINDKLSNEAEYDEKGNNKRYVIYEYDENGRLISVAAKEAPYDEKYLVWNGLEFYFYKADKKPVEKLVYYRGILNGRIIYTYNKYSVVLNELWYGDVKNIVSKTNNSYIYHEKGKLKGKLKTIINNNMAVYDGKEAIECCTTYSMKPDYDSSGNMTILTFFNCENTMSGTAVIEWEKGKTDVQILVKEIFESIHWYFTGC